MKPRKRRRVLRPIKKKKIKDKNKLNWKIWLLEAEELKAIEDKNKNKNK